MRRLLTMTIAGTFVLGAGGALAACDSDDVAETLIERTTGEDVDIDTDDGSVRIGTDEGDFEFGTCDELPEDFPSDVPTPDASPTACTRVAAEGDVTWSLVYDESDANAISAYRSVLEDDGFEVDETFSIESGDGTFESFGAEKAPYNVIVSSTATVDEGGITILVNRSGDDD